MPIPSAVPTRAGSPLGRYRSLLQAELSAAFQRFDLSGLLPPAPLLASSAARSPRSPPPPELGSIAIQSALARAKLTGEPVGKVIMGQMLAAGAAQNLSLRPACPSPCRASRP